MKKHMSIIAVCLLGTFTTVINLYAEDNQTINKTAPLYSRSIKHFSTKGTSRQRQPVSQSFSLGLDNKKDGISINLGTESDKHHSSNCSPYYPSSRGIIIKIRQGVRIFLPFYSRHAYLQKWYSNCRRWKNVKIYPRVIR